MTTHDRPLQQQLASDNYAGLCPEALAALEQANQGHAPSYGQVRWTAEASDQFRALFETPREVFFMFNGTAANALALDSLCQSSQHHLPPPCPYRNRRVRRPGVLLARRQAAADRR